jgi:hypothetical protein
VVVVHLAPLEGVVQLWYSEMKIVVVAVAVETVEHPVQLSFLLQVKAVGHDQSADK